MASRPTPPPPQEDANEALDSSSSSSSSRQPSEPRVASIPETLTLRGPGVVLKTPGPEDDDGLREIFSDPVTVKWLPHFHRPDGWSLEEIASRREKQIAAQREGRNLTLFIHVRGKPVGDVPIHTQDNDADQGDLTLGGTTGFPSMDLAAGECEIGIIMHHPFWRKGIATEALYLCLQHAFESLQMQTVKWVTSKDNMGMRAWCEGLHLRCQTMMTDEMGDSLKFELSRAEWGDRVKHLLERKVFPRED